MARRALLAVPPGEKYTRAHFCLYITVLQKSCKKKEKIISLADARCGLNNQGLVADGGGAEIAAYTNCMDTCEKIIIVQRCR